VLSEACNQKPKIRKLSDALHTLVDVSYRRAT
jgi:hypothetical protein